jgi:uncharacterized membrane protein
VSSTYDSVRRYTALKASGDTKAASTIVQDAIDRFADGTINADEYNALLQATMTPGARQ